MAREACIATHLLKIQNFFCKKPVRFGLLILLYVTAGTLVFLHSGFVWNNNEASEAPDSVVSSDSSRQTTKSAIRGIGNMGRVFEEKHGPEQRKIPPWLDRTRPGLGTVRRQRDHNSNWRRALMGRLAQDLNDGGAKYIGCYIDNVDQRALSGESFLDYIKMTVFRCQDYCAERGFAYAGLEFGGECYCGSKINADIVSESECDMECKGEKSNKCGGRNRLSVHKLKLSKDAVRRYGNAVFKGCFKSPENVTKALPVSAVIKNLSVDKCVDMCTKKEKSLAVLAGDHCYCGSPTLQFSLLVQESEDKCLHHCQGEESESCGNDEYYVVYQTEVQDTRCMDLQFFTVRAKQLVALASFPGAGNTWTRHLIEYATGIYTGSIYFDGALYNKGFIGEKDHWQSGKTVCIKTHQSGKQDIDRYDAAILLIRNPFKTLMAEFNRRHGGHTGFASKAQWQGGEWPQFVKRATPEWSNHALNWLTSGKNVLAVHYEDLKTDLFSQLKDIVQFLGLKVSVDRLLCVQSNKDGNFKRSSVHKLEYDPFTPEMREQINTQIRKVDDVLQKRNMSGIPEEYMPR